MAEAAFFQALTEYDRRSVTLLSEIRQNFRKQHGYLDTLVGFIKNSNQSVSQGASWILKAELEDGAGLSASQQHHLIESLILLSSWQAILHMLQIIDRLTPSKQEARSLIAWAHLYTNHTRPFLRAWSLHVIVKLTRNYPEIYDGEITHLLAKAENDPAASVRARARQLRQ